LKTLAILNTPSKNNQEKGKGDSEQVKMNRLSQQGTRVGESVQKENPEGTKRCSRKKNR